MQVFEATSRAGGRCRSYFDNKLNMEIDNGNHIILSANQNFLNFCRLINSEQTLNFFEPKFNFFDMHTKNLWSIKLNNGVIPFWIMKKSTRIPGTKLLDYFALFKLFFCKEKDTVDDLFNKNTKLYNSFWEPITLGILNTQCNEASAKLLLNVLKETFLKGGKFCKIIQPKKNWNETLIFPAIKYLKNKKTDIKYNTVLKELVIENNFIRKLVFSRDEIKINKLDRVILSTPLGLIGKFFPEVKSPKENNTILNIHFKIKIKIKKKENPILGIINSLSHWIFIKKDHISVTISAANKLNHYSSEDIARLIWSEVEKSLSIRKEMPDFQVIKEKKATYNQSPSNIKLIRNIKILPKNLSIAGDWTQKNLPSTIESAILSGKNSLKNIVY